MFGGPFLTRLNSWKEAGGIPSGLFVIGAPVTSVCNTPGDSGQELGLTYTKPTDGDAATGGLVIHYTAGGDVGIVEVPVDEVLCGATPTEPLLAQECHR